MRYLWIGINLKSRNEGLWKRFVISAIFTMPPLIAMGPMLGLKPPSIISPQQRKSYAIIQLYCNEVLVVKQVLRVGFKTIIKKYGFFGSYRS